MKTIDDILLRRSLQIHNCRGQCYDSASSMAGCRTGVATILREREQRALYTHCYGYALNLAVQEVVQQNIVLRDALDIVEGMTKLIRSHREGKEF